MSKKSWQNQSTEEKFSDMAHDPKKNPFSKEKPFLKKIVVDIEGYGDV